MQKGKISQIYGNRGFVFDFILSVIILVFLILLTSKLSFDYNSNFITSLIGFLGIIAGFMLTAFSLLLLYNPKEEDSPKFNRLRKSDAFKYALKYFISTILVILISVALLFINLINQTLILKGISLFFVILSFIVLLRCLYYLFALIDFEYYIKGLPYSKDLQI